MNIPLYLKVTRHITDPMLLSSSVGGLGLGSCGTGHNLGLVASGLGSHLTAIVTLTLT